MTRNRYAGLSEEEKADMREGFLEMFKKTRWSKDVFIEGLSKMAKQLNSEYPQDKIYCLGRGPLWITETSRLLDNSPERYEYIAFSGGWFNSNSQISLEYLPKETAKTAYRNYLEKIGMSPQAIINRREKTIIVEYTYTGNGLFSFVHFLSSWAKELGLFEQLKNKIILHILFYSEGMRDIFIQRLTRLVIFNAFAYHYQKVDRDIVGFLQDDIEENKNSLSIQYDVNKWTELNPINLKPSVRANLILFKIIDYLYHQNQSHLVGRLGMVDTVSSNVKYQDLSEISLEKMKDGDVDTKYTVVINLDEKDISDAKITEAVHKELLRTNWQLRDEWRNEGLPKEQATVFMKDGSKVDIYNWNNQKLSDKQILQIQGILNQFFIIANGKALQMIRHILIKSESKINPLSREEFYGENLRGSNFIILYPRALTPGEYRMQGVLSKLEAALIHELTHNILQDLITNDWIKAFSWRRDSPKRLKGGEITPYQTNEPQRCINEYAAINPQEDIAESMTACLINPAVLDSERRKFLTQRFLSGLDFSGIPLNSQTQRFLGEQITLPKLESPVKYRVKITKEGEGGFKPKGIISSAVEIQEKINKINDVFMQAMGMGIAFLAMPLEDIGVELGDIFKIYDSEYDVYAVRDKVMPIISKVTGMGTSGGAFNLKGMIVATETTLQKVKEGDQEELLQIQHERRHNDYGREHGDNNYGIEQLLIDDLYAYFSSFVDVYGEEAITNERNTTIGKGEWYAIVAKTLQKDYIDGFFKKEIKNNHDRQTLILKIWMGAVIIRQFIINKKSALCLEYLKKAVTLDQILAILPKGALEKGIEHYAGFFKQQEQGWEITNIEIPNYDLLHQQYEDFNPTSTTIFHNLLRCKELTFLHPIFHHYIFEFGLIFHRPNGSCLIFNAL